MRVSSGRMDLNPVGDVAQLGRAPESHSGGRGFESHRLHQFLDTQKTFQFRCVPLRRNRKVWDSPEQDTAKDSASSPLLLISVGTVCFAQSLH